MTLAFLSGVRFFQVKMFPLQNTLVSKDHFHVQGFALGFVFMRRQKSS